LGTATVTLSDEIKEAGGIVYVEATATYKDGDEAVSVTAQAGIDPNRKGMDVAQSFGSSSSYARKYALSGLFCIDDTRDADATNNHKPQVESKKLPPVNAENLKGWMDLMDQAVNYEELQQVFKEQKDNILAQDGEGMVLAITDYCRGRAKDLKEAR